MQTSYILVPNEDDSKIDLSIPLRFSRDDDLTKLLGLLFYFPINKKATAANTDPITGPTTGTQA